MSLTKSNFLSLPPEMVTLIVSSLRDDDDPRTLDSLSMADSNCRHFVRIVRPLEFRFGLKSLESVFTLATEAINTLAGQKTFPVGSYFRKVRFPRLPQYVGGYWSSLPPDCYEGLHIARKQLEQALASTASLPAVVQDPAGKARNACMNLMSMDLESFRPDSEEGLTRYRCYRDDYQSILRAATFAIMRLVMPNLESLEWCSSVDEIQDCSWPDLNDCIHRVRHLNLELAMSQWCHIQVDPARLRLQSIVIKSQRGASLDEGRQDHMKTLVALLTACAPHLREVSLDWKDESQAQELLPDKHPTPPLRGSGSIVFPSIQTLRLYEQSNIPEYLAWSLLTSPARNLVIGFWNSPWCRRLHAGMGQLPALESIVLPEACFEDPENRKEMIGFLDEHRLIKSIEFGREDLEIMVDHIIPLLGDGGFQALRRLRLVCKYNENTDSQSVEVLFTELGKIESLEELHIYIIWRPLDPFDDAGPWKADHGSVRKLLERLERLRVLQLHDSAEGLFGAAHIDQGGPTPLDVTVADGLMQGPRQAMTLLRARRDLDDEYFNNMGSDYPSEIWQDDEDLGHDSHEDDGNPWVRGVRDPYCALSPRDRLALLLRNAVLKEADAYLDIFARLESLILGGLWMDVKTPRCSPRGNATTTRESVDEWMWLATDLSVESEPDLAERDTGYAPNDQESGHEAPSNHGGSNEEEGPSI